VTTSPPDIDLHEAIRAVVRLLPEGETLASKLSNEWIVEGYGRWISDQYDHHGELSMVRLYGQNWRVLQPLVIAGYEKAVAVLREVLRTSHITGVGVSDAAREIGLRRIETHEWSSYRPNVPRGSLEAAHLPTIRSILVNREQLVAEATLRLAPPRFGSHRHKREATDAAINKIGIGVLARMSQKELEAAILKQVADDNNELRVCARYARERLSEAQKS
jgi:hypothetical protein